MKALGEIELQLSRLGIRNRFWGKPEVRELQNVLSGDEVITKAVNGRYEGGFALLVTTDRRLLLIDKKIWFLSMEDIRYDMISEVDYSARLLDSTISVLTINKMLRFTSLRQNMLRSLTSYLQYRVMELRQQTQQLQAVPLQQQFINPVSTIVQAQPQQQPIAAAANDKVQALKRIAKIGAYPTSSFTVQRRFTK